MLIGFQIGITKVLFITQRTFVYDIILSIYFKTPNKGEHHGKLTNTY